METTSINLGYQPANVKETPISLHVSENVLKIQENLNARFLRRKENATYAILLALNAILERCINAILTHRTAVGGVALMGGMVLATGADNIPQALLTLAAFMVAGACLHEKEEKGGEA